MAVVWTLGIALVLLLLLKIILAKLNQRFHIEGKPVGGELRTLEENKRKYQNMTEALLLETEKEERAEAVLYNLFTKMSPELDNVWDVLQGLSEGRRYIYAVYTMTQAIAQGALRELAKRQDAQAQLIPCCMDALNALAMPRTKDALETALSQATDASMQAYLDAFDLEDGFVKMGEWIGTHAAQFCDEVSA